MTDSTIVKVQPKYVLEDGTILIPRSSITAEVQKWVNRHVTYVVRGLAQRGMFSKGDSCPICSRALEDDLTGRYSAVDVPDKDIS